MNNFVNLHVHSDKSFDSILTIDSAIERLKSLNQDTLVFTEHGHMRGIIGHAQKAYKADLKYIPGIEAYVTFDKPTKQRDEFNRLYYHLLLLAKNRQGYQALNRLVSKSYQKENYYYKPRLSLEDVFKESEHLICTSGCIASVIAQTIIAEAGGIDQLTCAQHHTLGCTCNDHDVPEDLVLDPNLFGARSLDSLINQFTKYFKDDFYLELQDSGAGYDQDIVNKTLIEVSKDKGIPLIATSDAHYSEPWQASLRSTMLRIRHGKSPTEETGNEFYSESNIHLKSGEELKEIFGEEPIKNTVELASKCDFSFDFETKYFPAPIPTNDPLETNFKELTWKLFNEKFPNATQEYIDRLAEEIETIESMGYGDYFLVLHQILNWCKENNILIGPARGCLTKDARVFKNKLQSCALNKIKVGDLVLSHAGNFQKVVNTFKYPVKEKLLNLKFYYGDSDGITLTKDHHVFAEKSKFTKKWRGNSKWQHKTKKFEEPTGKWSEIPAEELSVGDWIYHPKPKRNINLSLGVDLSAYTYINKHKTIVKEQTLIESVPVNYSFKGSIRDIHRNTKVSRGFINKLLNRKINPWEIIKTGTNSQKTAFTKVLQYLDSLSFTFSNWQEQYSSLSKTEYQINKIIWFDEDFMWLLGKWTADGWLVKNKRRVWGICFSNKEIDQIQKVTKWLDKQDITYRLYPHAKKDLLQIEANSETLVNYFKFIFPSYRYTSSTKTIPSFLYKANDRLLLSFLKGYFDGDGSFKASRITATTISKILAEQIKQCLLYLNIPSSIRTETRTDTREEFKNINISYYITCPAIGVLTKYYPKAKASYRYKVFNDGFMTQLKSIDVITDVDYVYDIEVENDHSYVTTNGAVHNSAAGSLVSYVLQITQVDPIKYGLYFSRFLNKSRVSLPDVDADCPRGKRDLLIKYITKTYGSDKVAQIMTFSSLKPKSLARDICRSLGEDKLGDEIANLIPPPLHGKDPTVKESLAQAPKLNDKKYKHVVDKMLQLEGMNRTSGIHAAGLIISSDPIKDICPIEYQGKEKDQPVIQVDMNEAESIGLVKMDFLGLRTLDIIQGALDLIDEINDPLNIPLDDNQTFRELCSTQDYGGIFQFEGAGIGNFLHEIQPTCIEDISVATSLFRPGPLNVGSHEKYLERKNSSWFPENKVEILLKDTYGLLVYQEQLIRIAIEIAGFSEVDADSLRKATGKKSEALMAKYKEEFIQGCIKVSNLSLEESKELWHIIEVNSSYSFNLAHAISYSILSYWTAYLRTHYPTKFLASVINNSFEDKSKLINALKTCKNLNIEVLPPQISSLSELCISIDSKTIQLGIGACKYLKKGSKDAVKVAKNKPKSLVQFFAQVNRSKFNSGKAVALAKSGALDDLAKKEEVNRTGLIELIPKLYEHFNLVGKKIEQHLKWQERRELRDQQEKLKAEGKDYGKRLVSVRQEPEIPPAFDFEPYKSIQRDHLACALGEHEILGFCLTYYPMDFMNKSLEAFTIQEAYNYGASQLAKTGGFSWKRQVKVKVVGIVSEFKEHLTRKKQMRATFLLEDHTGIIECNIFTKAYSRIRNKLDDHTCIEAECVVLKAEDEILELSVNNYRILEPIENAVVPNREPSFLEAKSFMSFEKLVEENDSKFVKYLNISYRGS